MDTTDYRPDTEDMQSRELDIIASTRAEVMGAPREASTMNPFLIWGYPSAFFLFLEFVALLLWHKNWCAWLWVGIPLVAGPLMAYALHQDYSREHRLTRDSNAILQMWLFMGVLSAVGGASMGFAGVFEFCYGCFQGVIIGLGCFVTGVILRFQPKIVCGVIGSIVAFASLFFQGDLWPWQLLIAAVVAVITLIIPGHMFNNYLKNHGI